MSVGKIEAFDHHKDNWSTYVDRLEQYFVVNDVKEDRKVALLITALGAESYDLLVTLCTPTKPSQKKYGELVELMSDHLEPGRSILAERYKFRQRKQSANESIADYIADLQRLSKYCDFGNWLNESLRDQLVCGLYNENIRLRLFTEKDLKFSKAKQLAMQMEAAEKNAALMQSAGRSLRTDGTAPCFAINSGKNPNWRTSVRNDYSNNFELPRRKISYEEALPMPNGQRKSNSSARPGTSGAASGGRARVGPDQARCSACGGMHVAHSCKFRVYVCRICNQEGHLKKMCPKLLKITGQNYIEEEHSVEENYDLEFQI
ncbi:uncharacterized protein [Choristoneura fumiferana]|uniref:uncharacterized protein n=1 Tax=Choristoneura fumiferana TaxID=7141 RepID=UPI003D15B105